MGMDLETIYIVDDEPAVLEALSSLLRASGKNVRLFSSGADFLSAKREAWTVLERSYQLLFAGR